MCRLGYWGHFMLDHRWVRFAGAALLVVFTGFDVFSSAAAQPVPNVNQYGPGLIGAPAAWAAGYTGQGIVVTVADTGIDPNHPAFVGKIDPRSQAYVLSAPGAAFSASAFSDLTAQSHGTHVAGTVAASGASQAPGIAYNANLLVLKILSSCAKGQNCDAVQFPNSSVSALDFFTAQADTRIYNASYGPEYASPPGNFTIMPASFIDAAEADSLQKAVAANKIIVAATGNDRDTSPVAGRNPSGIALDPFIRPGNANAGVYQNDGKNYDFSGLLNQPGIIVAVTSVGQAKTIASYAQLCGVTASWCVAAPGGNQSQDGDAGIWSTLPNNTYGYMQGTSMAAPAVSGALADLQQAYPTYSGRELATVLFATAENVGGMLADNATYGYGLIRLDRAVAGPTTLAAGVQVNIAARQATYWSQPLTTAGGFTVAGPGYLIVAGRTTATGDVAVTGGALGVDGTLTLSTGLSVAQGGMLAGFGRVVGNTTINGTLNAGQLPNYADVAANSGGSLPAGTPLTGTSPGTLTFQGNVALGATAITRVNIDGTLLIPGGPGTFDKIIVTGTGNSLTAGGTLTPVLRGIPGGNNTYSPAPGTMFAFITADGGATLAGQFAALVQPGAGLAADTRLDVVYGASAITLNVTPLNFKALAVAQNLDQNAQNLAGAVDGARPAPGARAKSSQSSLFNDLYDNSVGEDDSELAALAGEGLAALPMNVLSSFTGFSELLAGHQAGLRAAGPQSARRVAFGYGNTVASDADSGLGGLAGSSGENWSLWGAGLGSWSKTGMDDGIAGSSGSASGFALGVDRGLSPSLAIGAAFSFSRADLASAGVIATTRIYTGAAYVTWMPANWVIDARLTGGPVNGRTYRVVSIAGTDEALTGTPDGWGLLAAAETGYRLAVSGAEIEPYAGLTMQTYGRGAYGETGSVGLDFPHQYFSRVQPALGARLSSNFEIAGLQIDPHADVAWTHDMGDAGLTMQAEFFDAPFLIDAARPARDAARVRAGVSILQSNGFSLFADYDGEFRSNATSHAVTGGIRMAL
jgi:uncharacterized protein with beta-barrel porin domain